MNKVKEFLTNGHPVKIAVTTKSQELKSNPTILEAAVNKVLDLSKEIAGSIQPSPDRSPLRRDFLLNPKPKSSTVATK